MAEVTYSIEAPPAGTEYPEGTRVVTWTLATGDTGMPYIAPHRSDKSIQISGTIGTSTAAIEGTNEVGTPAAWCALRSPDSVVITATSGLPILKQILENSYRIRPTLTGGAGGSVVFRLLVTTVARR